jgi:hypothetical protein
MAINLVLFSCRYQRYWQLYGVNFIIYFGVLCYVKDLNIYIYKVNHKKPKNISRMPAAQVNFYIKKNDVHNWIKFAMNCWWENKLCSWNRNIRGKCSSLPIYPSQLSYELSWDWNGNSEMRNVYCLPQEFLCTCTKDRGNVTVKTEQEDKYLIVLRESYNIICCIT